MMTAQELVNKAVDIAKNYKTLYVMGCFGAPMTAANKTRYIQHHAYNQRSDRKSLILAASTDTFGFDCVNLIKGILWGWKGDTGATYGGAKYAVNGVPDTSANGMISLCKGVTTDFSKIEVGEAVWCEGHIGVYIGGGLAVECTPKWQNRVQITAVGNLGTKAGCNTRVWTKHGKLPWVDYSVQSSGEDSSAAPPNDSAGGMADEGIGHYDSPSQPTADSPLGEGAKTYTKAEVEEMLEAALRAASETVRQRLSDN